MTIESLPNHAIHPFFDVRNDCLYVGDRSLTELARQIGRTPFYLYSRAHMSDRVASLRKALPSKVHLHYAMKANPMPAVVAHMASLVDGIDVASAAEMQVAISVGVDPAVISFAGPGKSPEELSQAAAAGIVVNLESEREMRRLADIARRDGIRPKVAVRVNPDFELKTSGMKMSGGPKQFGIDAERVPEVLKELSQWPLEFVGFHIFSGSQNLRADAIVDAQQKSVALAFELAKSAPAPVRILNIGGGFGIPHFPGEQPLQIEPIAKNLAELAETVGKQLPQAQLVIELGRYLVQEAGIYVSKVIDRKMSRGQVFLIVNGGLHHHLSASGNFGQVIRKNYPVIVGNKVKGTEREVVSVVGPLCTPLDLLADKMELAKADVDDLIVILQSGAYGPTASPLGFLSHPLPAEILV